MGIKQIKTGDTVHNILPLYGTCSTAADTVAKVVSLDNFVLETGSRISVKFTYANSVANPTLNVNSTGAKAIYYNGGTMNSTSEYWLAGSIMDFIYDGTHWVMMGVSKNTDTNTTYTIATGDSNGQIKITPSNADAYNVAVKGLAAAAYKEVTDSTSASAISTGTSLVTERDVYYGLPKINNSNSYTRSTTIYAPTAGGTSKYFLCGAGTTTAPTWASPATARTNLGFTYGTGLPTEAPSTGDGSVYFFTDELAPVAVEEGGTGATNGTEALTNLGAVDFIIEKGSNGPWHYQKWNSGKMDITYSGYCTFTSGYAVAYIALAHLGVHLVTTDSNKYPVVMAAERYIGDKRNADTILNCAVVTNGASDADHDNFVIYGRSSANLMAGSYYIDIVIHGFWK